MLAATRVRSILGLLALLLLALVPSLRAQDSFTIDLLEESVDLVMGDPFGRLEFDVTNDGASVGQIKFLTLILENGTGTGTSDDLEWLRDLGDPPGWEHKEAFKTYELNLEPTAQIPPGGTIPLQTFVTGPNGGVIPAGASDIEYCIAEVSAVFTGGNNGISFTPPNTPCFLARGLAGNVFATPTSVGVGNLITVTMEVTNRSTSVQTSIEPMSMTTASLDGANATLVTSPTTTLTLNPGETGTFTWTYQATAVGVINFTGQAGVLDYTDPLNPVLVTSTEKILSNDVVIGPFTAQLRVDPLAITSGQVVTVTMTISNNSGSNLGNVTPSALTFCGSADTPGAALTGPTPAQIPSLKKGTSTEVTWTYTITGDPNETYCFEGSASTTSGGGQTTPDAVTNPIGVIGQVVANVTPDSVGSGSVNQEVCWTVGNTSGKDLDQVFITIPAGWVYSGTASGMRGDGGGSAWTVTQNGSTIEFEAPNKASELPDGGTGEFCITFSQVPNVTGDTAYSFPVRMMGPSVDVTQPTQVTVTARKLNLTHSPAGPIPADGASEYTMSARLTDPVTSADVDIDSSTGQVTASFAAFGSTTTGDFFVIGDTVYTIASVDSPTQITITSPPSGDPTGVAATTETPIVGATVTFTTSVGTLSSTTAVTDASGVATVQLRSPPSTTNVNGLVQAVSGSAEDFDAVAFTGFTGCNLLFVGGTLAVDGNPDPDEIDITGTCPQTYTITVDVRSTGTGNAQINASDSSLTITDTFYTTSTFNMISPASIDLAPGSQTTLSFQGTVHCSTVAGVSNLIALNLSNGSTCDLVRPVDDVIKIISNLEADVTSLHVTPRAAGGVVVAWVTGSEVGTDGFFVERSLASGGPWVRLNPTAMVPGAGDSTVTRSYVYTDTSAGAGEEYLYRVVEKETGGSEIVHPPVSSVLAPPPAPVLGSSLRPVPGGGLTEADAGIFVLEADATGYLLELRAPRFHRRRVENGGWEYDELTLPDLVHANVGEPGAPRLPVVARLLSRPPGAKPQVTVLEVESKTWVGVVPMPQYTSDVTVRDEVYYSAPGPLPATWVEVEDAGFGGETPLCRIRFHPLRVRPATREVDHATRVQVRVTWAAGGSDTPAAPDAVDPAVRAARGAATAPPVKIRVGSAGVVRVLLADLAAFEPALGGTDPATWRVLHSGAELPVRIQGDLVTPGSYLELVAAPRASKFSADDVYWLVAEGTGVRVTEAGPVGGGAPTGVTSRVRADTVAGLATFFHYKGIPGPDEAERFFHDVNDALGNPLEVDVDLPALDGAGGFARVKIAGAGVASRLNPNAGFHRVTFLANGSPAVIALLDSPGFFEVKGLVPAPVSPLPIRLQKSATPDGNLRSYAIGSVEVTYPRLLEAAGDAFRATIPAGSHAFTVTGFSDPDVVAYDLSDPAAPVRLPVVVSGSGPYDAALSVALASAGEVLVAAAPAFGSATLEADRGGELVDPTTPVDVLAIVPAALTTTTLDDWVASREARGLRTRQVESEVLYDAWGDGRMDPEAIRRFLAHTLASWPDPGPRYLLLIGLAARDPELRSGVAPGLPVLPSHHRFTHVAGEIGSDPSLATVWGPDEIPDFATGRIPATSVAELRAVLEKVAAYEAHPAGDDFEERNLLIADKGEPLFRKQIHTTLRLLPTQVSATLARLGLDGDEAALQAGIQAAWTAGVRLVDFSGHGAEQTWTRQVDVLQDASGDLAPRLANGSRLPLVFTRTCKDGYAHFEGTFPSRAQLLLFNPTGGAIGCYSSAGEANALAKERLGTALMEYLHERRHRNLGDAVLAAQRQVLADGADLEDGLISHNLFGDPTTALHYPNPKPVTGLVAFIPGDGTAEISWEQSPELDLAGYRVYRGGQFLAEVPAGTHSWAGTISSTEPLVGPGGFTVNAVDLVGLEGASVEAIALSAPASWTATTAAEVADAAAASGGCAASPGRSGGGIPFALVVLALFPWLRPRSRRRAA